MPLPLSEAVRYWFQVSEEDLGDMGAFALRRLLQAVPTILGAVTLVFFLIRLAPGDPIDFMIGEFDAQIPPETVVLLRERYGLDRPLIEQYFLFMGRALQGDLGLSINQQQSVLEVLAPMIQPTLMLAAGGVLISVLLGIPAGIIAAVRRNSIVDYVVMTLSVLWVSMPSFWFGIILIYLFGFLWPVFPMFGGGRGSLSQEIYHLILPAVAIGARSMGLLARMSRSYMLEVMAQDFIKTARSKGLSERVVRWKHALRNVAIPITTLIGIDVAYLITGTVVIETVFARAGLGKVMIDAILFRDYPIVQGAIMLFALGIILVNLVTDLMYGFIDPRIRYG